MSHILGECAFPFFRIWSGIWIFFSVDERAREQISNLFWKRRQFRSCGRLRLFSGFEAVVSAFDRLIALTGRGRGSVRVFFDAVERCVSVHQQFENMDRQRKEIGLLCESGQRRGKITASFAGFDQLGGNVAVHSYSTSIGIAVRSVGDVIGIGVKKADVSVRQIHADIQRIEIAEGISRGVNCRDHDTDVDRYDHALLIVQQRCSPNIIWIQSFQIRIGTHFRHDETDKFPALIVKNVQRPRDCVQHRSDGRI